FLQAHARLPDARPEAKHSDLPRHQRQAYRRFAAEFDLYRAGHALGDVPIACDPSCGQAPLFKEDPPIWPAVRGGGFKSLPPSRATVRGEIWLLRPHPAGTPWLSPPPTLDQDHRRRMADRDRIRGRAGWLARPPPPRSRLRPGGQNRSRM